MPVIKADDEAGPGMDTLSSEAIGLCSAGAPGGWHGLHPR